MYLDYTLNPLTNQTSLPYFRSKIDWERVALLSTRLLTKLWADSPNIGTTVNIAPMLMIPIVGGHFDIAVASLLEKFFDISAKYYVPNSCGSPVNTVSPSTIQLTWLIVRTHGILSHWFDGEAIF